VAKDAVCEGRRCFVQEHKIDRASRSRLEPSCQSTHGSYILGGARPELHGDVDVAVRPVSASRRRPEHEGIQEVWLEVEHPTKRIIHSFKLARAGDLAGGSIPSTFDAVTSAGQVTQPFPSGDVLRTTTSASGA
jgi:hypothetical protein